LKQESCKIRPVSYGADVPTVKMIEERESERATESDREGKRVLVGTFIYKEWHAAAVVGD